MVHQGGTRMGPLATNVAAAHPQTSPAVINNLPVEVFHIIIRLDLPGVWDVRNYYDRLRALRLVSTSWSALIDNCPRYWRTISSSDPELVWRMALQKSQQAEIDVDSTAIAITQRRDGIPTTLTKAIVIHMPRVRKLTIRDQDLEYLIANVQTAPRLRDLSLEGGDNDPTALSFYPGQWAPNLRSTCLYGSPTAWEGLPWSNLESLMIIMLDGALPMEEILIFLAASPGLRSLDLWGIIQPRHSSHQELISTVKLEALESLTLHSQKHGMPFEALQSIIASPKRDFLFSFHASDENLRPENLRSIGRFAARIADGEAGSVLTLSSREGCCTIRIGGFTVHLDDTEPSILKLSEIFAHLVVGLPHQRGLAVETVEIRDTASNDVLPLLPIINSFCPNISHLTMPALNGDIASSIGGNNNDKWIFPHLESLSITCYRGGRHAVKAIQPRLKAPESGERLAKFKRLTLTFLSDKEVVFDRERGVASIREKNVPDQGEIAELDALGPEVIVNRSEREEA
ncbi:hypothetical protein FS837_000556 [Tulasnella sp. UAMH 9824]|nr:hypothetical protein FS837_000556 [Tulasnella sp. UAMH 9824]